MNKLPLMPTALAALLAYAPDSIVSRQLLREERLELVLFAVARGQDFDKHTTTREALVHIIDGAGEFFLTDTWHPFVAGDYFYMPANCVHALRSQSDFKFLLYLF